MKKYTIFIDESGTLPDPKDKVIVLAAVVPESSIVMESVTKSLRKIGRLKKQKGEIKFYTAGEKTKIAILETVIQFDIGIFVLVIDKKDRKIPDTPQHFALLCWLLISDIINLYKINEIIFDRHFFKTTDLEEFDQKLSELTGTKFKVQHVDSEENKKVNIADMIAGAVLAKESGKDIRFYTIIESKITNYKKMNWIETKRRLFKK
ncbi:MAG TPA: DUF3800 domain-containing protein [Candidatus Acidoferrales bacterium]|nr:DUF3800 domain-containing protein [Candidatus Acidoferrales bacterium]